LFALGVFGTLEKSEIIRQAWQLLEPELGELGFELVEVEYGGAAGSGQVLRLFMDKPEGGVTLDDCVSVSQVVNPLLESADWFSDDCALEVSSPGFDRPVRKEKDFARFAGERIHLQSNAAVNGNRRFRGVLTGIREGMIGVETDQGICEIHIENVKKANLDR